MKMTVAFILSLLMSLAGVNAAQTNQLSTPAMQQDYEELTQELRCPKCQNQNLAGSDSEISKSMKGLIKRKLESGESPEQIKQGLVARYGEFISYKPPVNRQTFVIWFFPPLLLGVMVLVWLMIYRRKSQSVVLTQEQRDELNRLSGQSDSGSGERS